MPFAVRKKMSPQPGFGRLNLVRAVEAIKVIRWNYCKKSAIFCTKAFIFWRVIVFQCCNNSWKASMFKSQSTLTVKSLSFSNQMSHLLTKKEKPKLRKAKHRAKKLIHMQKQLQRLTKRKWVSRSLGENHLMSWVIRVKDVEVGKQHSYCTCGLSKNDVD